MAALGLCYDAVSSEPDAEDLAAIGRALAICRARLDHLGETLPATGYRQAMAEAYPDLFGHWRDGVGG